MSPPAPRSFPFLWPSNRKTKLPTYLGRWQPISLSILPHIFPLNPASLLPPMAQHVTPFKDLNSLVIGVFQLITALLDAALDTCLSLSLSVSIF